MKKRVITLTAVAILFFSYGVSVVYFQVFPYSYMQSFKQYVQQNYNLLAETDRQIELSGVEILNTHLQRLAIKKVKLLPGIGFGGGISRRDNILYIVANKGDIYLYNLDQNRELNLAAPELPMNYSMLLESDIPNHETFRPRTFKVNGIYTESIDSNTHKLFVSHNGYDAGENCITWNISSVELEFQTASEVVGSSWNTIFTAEPCIDPQPENWLASSAAYSGNISGGRIIEYDQDQLLISVGDYDHHGMNGMPAYAMDESNPYGKFLLIDKQTGEWSIYAKGTRNPSGLFMDEERTIWSVENAPMGGDELNIIEQDENYGWPEVSYGLWYNTDYHMSGYMRGTHPEYRKPVFSWIPSIAPSNMLRIEGDSFEHWKGDLLVGTMRDRSLRRLRMINNKQVVYDERIPLGHRVRDMTVLPGGDIAIITDDSYLLIVADAGPIYKEPDEEVYLRIAELNRWDQMASPFADNSEFDTIQNSSRLIYERHCAACHNLTEVNQIGPHLADIYGREIGVLESYPYSNVLQTDKRTWTPELMKEFLMHPEREFSGNRMQHIELSEAEVDSLVEFMKK